MVYIYIYTNPRRQHPFQPRPERDIHSWQPEFPGFRKGVSYMLINTVYWKITITPKPELRGFWGDSLTKPPFGVTSAEVVIICPEYILDVAPSQDASGTWRFRLGFPNWKCSNPGGHWNPGTPRSVQDRKVSSEAKWKKATVTGRGPHPKYTPPKFNSSPLKNGGWKTTFLLER